MLETLLEIFVAAEDWHIYALVAVLGVPFAFALLKLDSKIDPMFDSASKGLQKGFAAAGLASYANLFGGIVLIISGIALIIFMYMHDEYVYIIIGLIGIGIGINRIRMWNISYKERQKVKSAEMNKPL